MKIYPQITQIFADNTNIVAGEGRRRRDPRPAAHVHLVFSVDKIISDSPFAPPRSAG